MAYNAISDADIDADSPINETLMTNLRDNPEAMIQGLTGATGLIIGAAVTNSSMGYTYGTQAITSGSTWTPSAGVYSMQPTGSGSTSVLVLELWDGAAWDVSTVGLSSHMGMIFDGTNQRLKAVNATITVSYHLWD